MTTAGNVVMGLPTWRTLSSYGGAAGRSGYGLTQLEDARIGYRWRSQDLTEANLKITQTWDRQWPTGGGAIGGHNLRPKDVVRLELFTDTGLTNWVKDTGFVPAWLLGYPFGSVSAEHYGFMTGRFTSRDISSRIATRPFWFGGEQPLARAARWSFQADGHPDGFVEIGLLDCFHGTQLRYNFVYGSALQYIDQTLRTDLPGGGESVVAMLNQRGFDADIRLMRHKEALAVLGELWLQFRAVPFLWLPYPERTERWQQEAFFARDASGEAGLAAAFTNHNGLHDRARVRLEELIV